MKGALLLAGALSLTAACGSTVQATGELRGSTSVGSTDPGLSGQDATAPGRQAPLAAPPSSQPAAGHVSSTVPGRLGPQASTPLSAGGVAHGPLKIGVLYSNNGAANAALAVTTSASGDPRSLMAALVAGLNRTGGLAGRRLVVTYDAVDATSSDYSTQANAACTRFTQDDPVPVVLDLAFGDKYGMASCLAQHGVLDVGIRTSDSAADDALKLFVSPGWMSSTRRYPAVLTGLHATGYVMAKNKLGVVLEDCPDLQRAYQQAVVPTITRLGLILADTEHLGCTTGFSSAGPASASIQSAVLHLRSSGADRLLVVSDVEQVVLLLLANDAESQGWHPGYLLSSAAETEVMRANIASGQWPQLHGVGWVPGLDVDDPHQPPATADSRCLGLISKGGLTVAGWQNTYVATTECGELFLLEAALRADGGDARGASVMTAVEQLGSRFDGPGIVAGRTSFGPGRYDGPDAVAPFGYVASCSCLRYVGSPVVLR